MEHGQKRAWWAALRVCVGENAAPSGPNSSPFSSAGVSVRVLDRRVDHENATYADNDSPPAIRQRRSLGIEEYKGFLGCDCAKERVEHRKLVPALLNPELIEFEVGLEFGSEVDLVGVGTIRDPVIRILHHPGERNSRIRSMRVRRD